MTDLSDFARPPKSRHVREKARLGRPMGFTPWSNEEWTSILDHIRYKKFEEKENIYQNENLVQKNSGTREALEASKHFCSARRFQISKIRINAYIPEV